MRGLDIYGNGGLQCEIMKKLMLKVGDHIKVWRGIYSHHGIYRGYGQVIHYVGEKTGKLRAAVKITTVDEFATGGNVEIVSHGIDFPADRVIALAESFVGKTGYNLLTNNCEHLARWCKTGRRESRQVKIAFGLFLAGIAMLATTRKNPPVRAFIQLAIVGVAAYCTYKLFKRLEGAFA